MPVSRQAVVHAYQLILGRDPESEASIVAHMACDDETALAQVLLGSAEFRASRRFNQVLQVREPLDAALPPVEPAAPGRRVLLLGNCQVGTLARLLQAMDPRLAAKAIRVMPDTMQQLRDGTVPLEAALQASDLVIVQPVLGLPELILAGHGAHAHKLRLVPVLTYSAFHPDCVYASQPDGSLFLGPMADYQSSVLLWACMQGWSETEALALFRDEVFESLGFLDLETSSRNGLLKAGQEAKFGLEHLLDGWMRSGPWLHSMNHPHLRPLTDLAEELLRREGLEPLREMAALVPDELAFYPVWPVYPAVAARLGGIGSYTFKVGCPIGTGPQSLDLEGMVRGTFAAYRAAGQPRLTCRRLEDERYAGLAAFRPRNGSRAAAAPAPATPAKANPYVGLEDHRFWRRAMELTMPGEVDPVVRARRKIRRHDKVATAGSCFAQHIARTLASQGFHYFVTEEGEGLGEAEKLERQFGVFSARYGNIYTARQLVQLVERAYGRFEPADTAWQRPDGRFVDPFRPQVEPGGFGSAAEVVAARAAHFAAVRRVFEQSDVFVFTLGLTEAWRRRSDGAVFPLAPGVVAGQWDPALYEFVNFNVQEVVADIRAAVGVLRRTKPGIRFVFTVSPVPLIATYEERHVLVSTTESKSVLRAAIAQVVAADPRIEYFPSYEVITGPHARGRYYAADLRSVTDEGVAHVMRLFMKHYGAADPGQAPGPIVTRAPDAARLARLARLEAEQAAVSQVLCDEEAIERARHRAA